VADPSDSRKAKTPPNARVKVVLPRYYLGELIAFVLTITAFTGVANATWMGPGLADRAFCVLVASLGFAATSAWAVRAGIFVAVRLGLRTGWRRLFILVVVLFAADLAALLVFGYAVADRWLDPDAVVPATVLLIGAFAASFVHEESVDQLIEKAAGRWLEDVQAADRLDLLPWTEYHFEIPGIDALDFVLAAPVVVSVTWYFSMLVSVMARWPGQQRPSPVAAFIAVTAGMGISAALCVLGARLGNFATGEWDLVGRAKPVFKLFTMLAGNFLGSPVFVLLQIVSFSIPLVLSAAFLVYVALTFIFLREKLRFAEPDA